MQGARQTKSQQIGHALTLKAKDLYEANIAVKYEKHYHKTAFVELKNTSNLVARFHLNKGNFTLSPPSDLSKI